jgi:hypothetical protein
MNTIQLNKILFNFPTTKDNYVGTFAIDKIPKSITYPSSMIINNEPSTRSGSHWIAIYFFKNKKAIFFDSYGQSAKSYKLNIFLKKNSVSFIENKQILQAYSPYCGYYCVLFIIFMSLGYNLKKYLKYFKTPIENDKLFKKLIKK